MPKRTKSADDDWGYVGPEDSWESVLTGAVGGLIGKIPARDVWKIEGPRHRDRAADALSCESFSAISVQMPCERAIATAAIDTLER